jgi:hypothetical protein
MKQRGRVLNHVYPATFGPHNPNLGHSVGAHGRSEVQRDVAQAPSVSSPACPLSLHAQWLDPLSDGANIGDMFSSLRTGTSG